MLKLDIFKSSANKFYSIITGDFLARKSRLKDFWLPKAVGQMKIVIVIEKSLSLRRGKIWSWKTEEDYEKIHEPIQSCHSKKFKFFNAVKGNHIKDSERNSEVRKTKIIRRELPIWFLKLENVFFFFTRPATKLKSWRLIQKIYKYVLRAQQPGIWN